MTIRIQALLALLLIASLARAEDHQPPRQGVLRTGFYFDPMFSYTRADHARDTGNGRGGTISLGYTGFDGVAALEASGFYTKLSHTGDPSLSNGKLEGALLDGLIFPLSKADAGPLQSLYAILGIGVQTQVIRSTDYEVGLGWLVPIRISEHYSFGVRADVRYRVETQEPPTQRPADGPPANPNPPPPEGTPTVQYHDWVYSVGLHIPLSREPEPPPPPKPEPVQVVPQPQPAEQTPAQPAAEPSPPPPDQKPAESTPPPQP